MYPAVKRAVTVARVGAAMRIFPLIIAPIKFRGKKRKIKT
jgi:hypothetical protein